MADDLFAQIRQAWHSIGAWVDRVQKLPATPAALVEEYGQFAEECAVGALASAVADAGAVAGSLGSVAATKRSLADDGGYLTGPQPPSPAYPKSIWWAGQVANAAATLSSTMDALRSRLEAGGTDADTVRSSLCGPQGMQSVATAAALESEKLADQVGDASQKITDPVSRLAGSQALTDAGLLRGKLTAAIPAARSQAEDDWKTATGHSLADEGPLPPLEDDQVRHGFLDRRKSEAAAKKYRTLRQQVTADEEQLAKTQRLLDDTAGLEAEGTQAIRSLADLTSAIRSVSNEFSQAAERIEGACNLATDEQLTDAAWLERAVDLSAFPGLAAAAQRFTERALVESTGDGGAW